jgi:beta-galactosidase
MQKTISLLLLSALWIAGCKNTEKQDAAGMAAENYRIYKNSTIPTFWKEPSVFEYGREKARAEFMPFETEPLAIAAQAANSRYFKSLNGFWKYQYFPGPDYVPADVEKASWTQVTQQTSFPGFMELKGFGKPVFKYYDLPFPHRFPEVPSDSNSVVLLQQNLQIPDHWKDREVFAVFEGISCAYFVYVNGKLAGYNEDSRAVSEFLLSPFLTDGPNTLTLVLYRWSDGSYFESHNQWHLTGIGRDAYLLARPKLRISDFFAQTDLNGNKGELDLEVLCKNNSSSDGKELILNAEIRNDSNKILASVSLPVTLSPGAEVSSKVKLTADRIKGWSDETPELYQLALSLKNSSGEVLEAIRQPLGFRSLRIDRSGMKINGRRVMIKGAVCHEFHPTNGNSLDKNWIENDADVLKLQSINAVRNNHYPFPPYWYQFMQKFGLYVLDEANFNLSSFFRNQKPLPPDTLMERIFLQRVKNMFERNKNYANIFAWSLGFECGNTRAARAVFQYIKNRDPRRAASLYTGSGSPGDLILSTSANTGERNDAPELVYRMSTHQGNGMGGFDETWRKISSDPRIIGGFIEDFTDQTFYMKDRNGKLFFAYGGDFGEQKSDSFRCVSGIMTSNKTPKPACKTVAEAFSNFTITASDLTSGILEIRNNHVFFSDTVFKYFWFIEENNEKVREGQIQGLQLKAGEKRKIRLDLQGYRPAKGKYCVLNIIVNKASRVNNMFRFQDVARVQFEYPVLKSSPLTPSAGSALNLNRKGKELEITGKDFSLAIDTLACTIRSIRYKETELLDSPLMPLMARAPVDNDIYNGLSISYSSWLNAWQSFKWSSCLVQAELPGKIDVSIQGSLEGNGQSTFQMQISVRADGDILLSSEIKPGPGTRLPPRLGWICTMPARFGNIKWVGRGPYDAFPDRKAGLLTGEFKTTASEFNVPLVRPQEMGVKTDLQWFGVSTFEGLTLAAYSSGPFEASVLPFAYSELFGRYKHGTDIPQAKSNTVIFSSLQAAVGDGIRAPGPTSGEKTGFRLRLKLTEDRSSTLWSHFAESW